MRNSPRAKHTDRQRCQRPVIPGMLSVLSWAVLSAAVVQGADLYVAPEGNDAWSGTRAEPNDAGTDGPFATLRRARDAVRKAKATEAVTVPFTDMHQQGWAMESHFLDLTGASVMRFTFDRGWIDYWIDDVSFYRRVPQ